MQMAHNFLCLSSSCADLPLPRRQVPYRRHIKGIEEDVLPAIPEVMLTIRLRCAVCHNVGLYSRCL